MTINWRGKHVWIIGASAGIGATLAVKLASEGAIIAASARDGAALKTLIDQFKGVGHMAVPLDVTDAVALKAGLDTIRNAWPSIDTIIYNAGAYTQISVNNYDLKAVNRMLDVNLRGAFSLLDGAIPFFKQQGYGHLALVASVAGYRGLPNALGYSASKAGLISLAESLRAEMKPLNVKVQVINPGFVKTRLVENNKFPMPFIVTQEQAAEAIFKGLSGNGFEIAFPKRFIYLLKFLGCLPNFLYFAIMRKLV